MINLYKIQFSKSLESLNDEFISLSEVDKAKILEVGIDSFLDYEESKLWTFLLLTSPLELEKYINILRKNLINYTVNDLTNQILDGQLNLENYLGNYLSIENSTKFSTFQSKIDQWIYRHLDLDRILDKISNYGISKLTDIEKKFLNDFHNHI